MVLCSTHWRQEKTQKLRVIWSKHRHFMGCFVFFFCCWFFGSFLLGGFHTREFFNSLPLKSCARHSWPLSSEGSLARHTYCVYNGHLRGPVTLSPVDKRLSNGAVTTCFCDLCLSRLEFAHPTFRMRGERSYRVRHRRGFDGCKFWKKIF